jgi:hypothetical protein
MGGVHKVNAGFTVLLPLRPERVESAAALLEQMHANQPHEQDRVNPVRASVSLAQAKSTELCFSRSTTTHFATITIIPAQYYVDELLPATLLFATSFCGPARAHVDELVVVMGDGLRAIFAHVDGFDPDCSDDDLEWFLLKNRTSDTFYSGMQNLSPQDVRRNRLLRQEIEAFIDRHQPIGGLSGTPDDVRKAIQEYVSSREDLAWARETFKPPFFAWALFHWRSLAVEAGFLGLVAATIAWFIWGGLTVGTIVAIGWLLVLAFVALVLVMLVTIREAEDEQTYISQRPSDERARLLASTQTRPVINEFTLAGPIKTEGSLRPLFLRISLWVIARVAEGIPFVPVLGDGINIPTVATARWISADGGKRLMFISNYHNEGKAYVRDFIETPTGAVRINLSFGFGMGYPKTRWIAFGGALDDPNAYLYSLAENQLPTLFWYGPYRDISVDNIKRDRKIREGLFDNKADAQKWLHLL